MSTNQIVQKRGHNAIVTGLAMLVFGTIAGLIFGVGLGYGVAFAGFITLILGYGIRRETPRTN